MTHNTLSRAQALKAWSVEHRRHLHQYPELSLKEQRTADYCKQVLAELGYHITSSFGYGFTADLNNASSKTIALRADMDALPIQEKNTHDFVSKHDGCAHMCGHDTHMTIALTTARLLTEHQQPLPCNVRFLFQPSEESPPGGAPGMIEAGCLNDVDEIYGLHNDPGTPIGKIRTRSGALLAAADLFKLTITGRGCHAARPQDGLDPLYPAAQLINQWQGIITRYIDPAHPAVLSVTQCIAGDTFNVIPDTAMLAGTIRTFSAHDRQLIQEQMQNTLTPLITQGYQCELEITQGYDAVINHQSGVNHINQAAQAILNSDDDIDTNTDPAGWAEDFAYYLQHKPGAFFLLGSGNPAKQITAPLHSPHFDIDEDALPIGAAIMTELVLQTKTR